MMTAVCVVGAVLLDLALVVIAIAWLWVKADKIIDDDHTHYD